MATRSAGPIIPSPRLVLFDLDDTLCDYASARALRLRLAFTLDLPTPAGNERDVDRMIADSLTMHPHGADHFPELFARHGIVDPAIARVATAWYRGNKFHGLELFADAVETIAALRWMPGPDGEVLERTLGIITNGPADIQRDKIRLLGVDGLVDFAIVSGEFGIAKPDRRIFEEALRLGAAIAAEAVFVGDSPEHDMAGARTAGIRSIWVNRTGAPWPGTDAPPDFEVDRLAALLPLLGAAAGVPAE